MNKQYFISLLAVALIMALPQLGFGQSASVIEVNKALLGSDTPADIVAEDGEVAQDERPPPKNAWQKYTRFLDGQLEKLGHLDLYGVTAQLPKGYFSVKWDYTQLKAGRRYNSNHVLGPAVAPIPLSLLNPADEGWFLDTGLTGSGGGHVFQASYGITNTFNWYFELPYQFMHTRFDPKVIDKDGNLWGGSEEAARVQGRNKLRTLLPMVGRPVVGLKYDADWILADINTGFSWNPWRTERLSTALTARVFFPTGRVADPDNSLMYATGPELDTGVGGWILGFTNGWDLRIFKYKFWIDIIASSEFTASYGFKQKRRYPTVIEPDDPNADSKRGFTKPKIPGSLEFPDLTKDNKEFGTTVKGTFDYTPGWSLSWTGQLNVQIALLGLGFGYGILHSQEPEIQGDYRFIMMARSLELLGQNTIQAIQLGATLSLLPLYVPVNFAFQWRKMVDGYNAIVFDDYWNIIVKVFIPIFPD
ncbi:MAG: hypothetical protein ACOX51_02560 [Myxococcota bacterium]